MSLFLVIFLPSLAWLCAAYTSARQMYRKYGWDARNTDADNLVFATILNLLFWPLIICGFLSKKIVKAPTISEAKIIRMKNKAQMAAYRQSELERAEAELARATTEMRKLASGTDRS